MSTYAPRIRQVVDWGAAVWAGLISGLAFLLLNIFLIPVILGGNAWIIIRLFGSIVLGQDILAPPATFDLLALLAAFVVNFVLAIAFSLIVAFIIHRGGLLSGIIGGALLGIALYFINFYTLTLIFPWFFAMRSWVFILTHAIFGALAGGIYESLEVEEFVPVRE